jgi:membrane protein CcdC involved in cytochrome C biogenesis
MRTLAFLVLLLAIVRLYITINSLILNGWTWDTLIGAVIVTWGIWFFEKYRQNEKDIKEKN